MQPVTIPDWLRSEADSGQLLGDSFPPEPSGKTVLVYGLVDPRNNAIRYVGKTIHPQQRMSNHMNEISNCHRSHWLQELKRLGLTPTMIPLTIIDGLWPWQYEEKWWIKHLRSRGCNLVNNTDGGDGVSGLPEETRKRMGLVWLGRKHTPEALRKMAAASSGRKFSSESRAKQSRAHKGRVITWGKKLSASAHKFSADQVVDIFIRLIEGERVIDLAREYGCARTTISKINTGAY